MRRLRLQGGFTLAEIIVVVALLAILGTGALVGLKRQRDNVAFRKTVQNLNAINLWHFQIQEDHFRFLIDVADQVWGVESDGP